MTAVKVEQADQRLFLRLFQIPPRHVDAVMAGKQDEAEEMQLLAAHRQTALEAGRKAGREEGAKVAEEFSHWQGQNDLAHVSTKEGIAAAIRAIGTVAKPDDGE